jgi:hypothetical protein
VVCGDATDLPRLLPRRLRGTVDLVLTSPPYGQRTHGLVRSARGKAYTNVTTATATAPAATSPTPAGTGC